ncbi:uncharacterized protein CMC5_032490 [Chondromyces crocatus]|uniref:Methyltransferase domain-containing protein n=2 Tax=Chondromyces crocatus TaxID=52 RepID=A0A0K1EEK0_CHOCO|nr:uncharacterized protein CMC5_032490 [Chondromyces crocatus]
MLETLWDRYTASGLDAAASVEGLTPEGLFYLAFLAFADERYAEAEGFARRAAAEAPGDALFRAGVMYLARVVREGKHQVYVSPEGFGAFIRGGGNVGLYEATSAALARHYPEAAFDLLDVGPGDGLALLPALTPAVRKVSLVEPAAPLLAQCTEALAARSVAFEAFNGSGQAFVADPAVASRRWGIVQATFSLHAVPPAERVALLRWLREHGEALLVAEFDAPSMEAPLSPAIVRYVLDHYRKGIAEYEGATYDTVVQGFLMPVMFGYVDRGVTRVTFEEPIGAWEAVLREAGFAQVQRVPLYPYWWADAHLLVAR